MPYRDRPSIHIDLRWVEAELFHHRQSLHGECLIEFIEIDFVWLPCCLLPNLTDARYWSHHHPRRINAARRLGHDSRHWLCAELLRSLVAGHNHRSSTVVHSWSIAGGYRSIFLERGLQSAQCFNGRVFTHRLVFVEDRRRLAFLPDRQLHGNNLRLEAAFFPGCRRFAVRVQRVFVLLLAGDAVLFRHVFTGHAHVVVVVNVPQPVVHHRVHNLRIAQPVSFARLGQQIRSVGHRFHSARDHDLAVAGLDRLRAERNCLQSGAADLVDGHRPHLGRQSAIERRLPRRVLSQTGGDHVAHDALIHLLGIDLCPIHRFAHCNRTELHRAQLRQRSLKLPHRRAHAGDDDNIVFVIDRHTECSSSQFSTLHYKMGKTCNRTLRGQFEYYNSHSCRRRTTEVLPAACPLVAHADRGRNTFVPFSKPGTQVERNGAAPRAAFSLHHHHACSMDHGRHYLAGHSLAWPSLA